MRLAQRKPAEAAPARMGALAKLPVFLDLADKRVVVAGGSSAAAWKAELLAAAGAHVAVFAPELSAEMSALIERGAAAGTITHEGAVWSPEVLVGVALALTDTGDGDDAETFAEAARKAGALFNVIDMPAHCQFQFGSIVNRSPVVIGISTDGAAPILGQAIRRRIETLLPPSLAIWGRLAKELRATVCATLQNGPRRRAFWERFTEQAFGPAPTSDQASTFSSLATALAQSDQSGRGKVTLVGAGPGDAELLTLKAVRALQAADVILYDDLVSDDVLELARREAKRMMVGKRGNRESCAQEDINDLMVKLARQGKHVVRLKSGDPMIFGRAGEEMDRLTREDIAVTVVPGVTSASAMAAELGLSLTHRDCAQSVRFITGHSRSGTLPADLDWQGLADPRTTLIVYMGGKTASELARRLLDAGLDGETPVVAMSAVSRVEAKKWASTLGALPVGGLPDELCSPVLLGIGAAFRCQGPEGETGLSSGRIPPDNRLGHVG